MFLIIADVLLFNSVLLNVQSPQSDGPLSSLRFGSSSLLPPPVSESGGLVCESVGKADLLSDDFDSKQSIEAIDLPLTCHPFPSLTTFAFRASEVRRLLLDLDPYGGTDPYGMFPLFLKRTADVMGPRLSVVSACWSGKFPCSVETGLCHPNSERSTVLLS